MKTGVVVFIFFFFLETNFFKTPLVAVASIV